MKGGTHEIDIPLRGQTVTFCFQASAPDPSVGLFGWTIEEYWLIDEDGSQLDWILTDEELQGIQPQVDGYMHGWVSDDYND